VVSVGCSGPKEVLSSYYPVLVRGSRRPLLCILSVRSIGWLGEEEPLGFTCEKEREKAGPVEPGREEEELHFGLEKRLVRSGREGTNYSLILRSLASSSSVVGRPLPFFAHIRTP
jgi:hypothetical protein